MLTIPRVRTRQRLRQPTAPGSGCPPVTNPIRRFPFCSFPATVIGTIVRNLPGMGHGGYGGTAVDSVSCQGVGMNRAAAGFGLLAGALLLIVIAAAVRGRMVPGQATAEPVTPPPQVGDCVTQDPNALGADLYTWTTVLPSVPTGPCTGNRFGEVVGVMPADTARAPIADMGTPPCQAPVDEYLGMQGTLPHDNGGFYRIDAVPVAVVGPDDKQRAAGQDWAACLVYLPLSGDAAAPLRIDHSLRGAWHHPVDSRLFTVCWEQAVPSPDRELLGTTPLRGARRRAPTPRDRAGSGDRGLPGVRRRHPRIVGRVGPWRPRRPTHADTARPRQRRNPAHRPGRRDP